MIVAGDLRYNISVERLTVVKDAYGAANSTYLLNNTYKCGVKYNGGSKAVNNDEIFASNSIVFTTYYRDILDTDRIVFNGKYYKILNIVPIGYREGLSITTELIND